jgi:phenylalanyl-tRNA synthetase alpha subunit
VTRDQLKVIQEKRTHDAKIIADLKKRKLLKMQKVISFRISKGAKFALEMVKEETDLTAEMLASGAWKTATFKPYNFNALGADQHAGALHPLNKVRQEFRCVTARCMVFKAGSPLTNDSFTGKSSSKWASQRCLPTSSLSRASG